MTTILSNFLKAKINIKELKNKLGENLYNVKPPEPKIVYAKDLIFIINQFLSKKMTTQEIVDWVNVVWFTDLFEYNHSEENSIASVMSILETLDEDDTQISHNDLIKMTEFLLQNKVYAQN